MVNIPKSRKTYCAGRGCRKHTLHKVTQYKAGKASPFAQGKRRYVRAGSFLCCDFTTVLYRTELMEGRIASKVAMVDRPSQCFTRRCVRRSDRGNNIEHFQAYTFRPKQPRRLSFGLNAQYAKQKRKCL